MMVKLKGPGLAQQAGGTLAGQVTFSNWKGKPYLKVRRSPSQPRTGGQIAMRAMMSFLSPAFFGTPVGDPDTWQPLADQSAISRINAYLGYNLERWRRQLPPTLNYPEAPSAPTRSWVAPTVQTIGRFVRITWNLTDLSNGWAIPCYRVYDPVSHGTWDQLIGLTYQISAGINSFDDLTPTVGLNRYIITLISLDGYILPSPWHVSHTFP